ncbi:MAG TPA: hypothetical protein PLY87_04520 [Planctomycetaceae bacterium]|nr:hypothetical protein [Planctomycetaceae bacterium]HRA86582.1 hypothetical protein [Planctomycetaceae bacterium]
MGTTRATKAVDKSQVCRKFVLALHKLYGKSVPGIDLPVIETMLFAACLEDNPWAPAEAGLKKLIASFFDLNEMRVSSVAELELALAPLHKADWKGLRIRSILRFVFESTYAFDYEKIRRQTLEQAVKTLKKIPDITPFIRDFVLHEILGSHIVCLDESMLTAALWLGLVPADSDLHDASEFLKGGLKKSEVSEFCYLLRCLATDPKFIPRFADLSDTEITMADVMGRFAELQLPPKKKPTKPPVVKEVPKSETTIDAKKSPSSTTAKSGVSATGDSKPAKPASAEKPAATVPHKPAKTAPSTTAKSDSKLKSQVEKKTGASAGSKKPAEPATGKNQKTVKPATAKVTKKK